MTDSMHLTEAERQHIAEGSASAGDERVAHHLATCAECERDVARLRALVRRVRHLPPPAANLADLWPAIRSRVQQTKIVPLAGAAIATASAASDARPRRSRLVRLTAWLAAAVVVIAAAGLFTRVVPRRDGGRAAVAPATGQARFAADSIAAYREETTRLLDQLELQRSLMRPSTRAQLDGDLRTIDQAIAELEAAIKRDPNNPALRQLLASSYRQKVELLKRVENAG
jgi:hypothetical protein